MLLSLEIFSLTFNSKLIVKGEGGPYDVYFKLYICYFLLLIFLNYIWERIKRGSKALKKHNIIVGLLGILLSIYVIVVANRFPGDILRMGPNFFPKTLAILMIIFSGILIVVTTLDKSGESSGRFNLKDPGIQRSFIALLGTIVYLLLFKKLGFVLDTILYLMFLMYLLKLRHYVQMILVSVAMSLTVFYIFRNVLNITLPTGLLFR